MTTEQVMKNGAIPSTWHGADKLRFVSLEELTNPSDAIYVQVIRDAWWSVHPKLGYIFVGKLPQCNKNKAIRQKLTNRLYPGASVLFVHQALVPIDLRDYQ